MPNTLMILDWGIMWCRQSELRVGLVLFMENAVGKCVHFNGVIT